MKGLLILFVFFSMFTVASLLIPSPMFPGNFFAAQMGASAGNYIEYLSAVFNGIFYGCILWAIFLVFSRRLEGEK
ncbi:MAG: hypothetical protein QHH24_04020 [Candidatus Bathyarchaeota archaeon]|nr:hypothetical protein [Candidatus Bathyarchaeota archaeon]